MAEQKSFTLGKVNGMDYMVDDRFPQWRKGHVGVSFHDTGYLDYPPRWIQVDGAN